MGSSKPKRTWRADKTDKDSISGIDTIKTPPQIKGIGIPLDVVTGEHSARVTLEKQVRTTSSQIVTETQWDNIKNKPATFPPSAHQHSPSDITPQGSGSNLDADKVDGYHASSFEFVANKGVANGYASLDANVKVVQEPASATATPAANKIVKSQADGKLHMDWISDNFREYLITLVVGDGVYTIQTGFKGGIAFAFSGTIIGWRIISIDDNPPTSGSIEIDVLKSSYTDFPSGLQSICGTGTKPNLSSAVKNESTNLTGWTTTINHGDIVAFNVVSVTNLKKVQLVLRVKRS